MKMNKQDTRSLPHTHARTHTHSLSRTHTSLLKEGVTTLELKSGYGLELESERRALQAVRSLPKRFPVTTVATFLGAHAVPPEFAGDSDGYIDACIEMMGTLHQVTSRRVVLGRVGMGLEHCPRWCTACTHTTQHAPRTTQHALRTMLDKHCTNNAIYIFLQITRYKSYC